MNKSYNNATPKIVGVIAMVAVLAVGSYVVLEKNSSDSTPVATVTSTPISSGPDESEVEDETAETKPVDAGTQQTTPTSQTTQNTTTSSLRDGEYTATTSYEVPGGDTNTLTIVITMKDGVIVTAKSDSTYKDRESTRYIDGFESGLSGSVVGKDIKNIPQNRIGGASLTTRAFYTAINTIINDASS